MRIKTIRLLYPYLADTVFVKTGKDQSGEEVSLHLRLDKTEYYHYHPAFDKIGYHCEDGLLHNHPEWNYWEQVKKGLL